MNEKPFVFLNSPQGKAVVKRLEQQFPRKTGETPLDTHVKSVQADVVDWIKRLIADHSRP